MATTFIHQSTDAFRVSLPLPFLRIAPLSRQNTWLPPQGTTSPIPSGAALGKDRSDHSRQWTGSARPGSCFSCRLALCIRQRYGHAGLWHASFLMSDKNLTAAIVTGWFVTTQFSPETWPKYRVQVESHLTRDTALSKLDTFVAGRLAPLLCVLTLRGLFSTVCIYGSMHATVLKLALGVVNEAPPERYVALRPRPTPGIW